VLFGGTLVVTSTGDGGALTTTVCVSSISCVTVIFSVAPGPVEITVTVKVVKQVVRVVVDGVIVVTTVPQPVLVELAGAARCNFRTFLKGGPVSVIVTNVVLVRVVVLLMVVFGEESIWVFVAKQKLVTSTVWTWAVMVKVVHPESALNSRRIERLDLLILCIEISISYGTNCMLESVAYLCSLPETTLRQ
jgi:hypothetical protein